VIYALLPGLHGGEISELFLRQQEAEMISTTDKSMDIIAAMDQGGHAAELRPFISRLTQTFLGGFADKCEVFCRHMNTSLVFIGDDNG
jgi:hypothetical protein